jgi:hypothetical protein
MAAMLSARAVAWPTTASGAMNTKRITLFSICTHAGACQGDLHQFFIALFLIFGDACAQETCCI